MNTTGFPPLRVIPPQPGHAHTHTAIMIHGRGSTGEEFAQELQSMYLSNRPGDDIFSHFPSWRWVFPSSRSLYASTFDEEMPQWFDIQSLTFVDDMRVLQMEGIESSTAYLLRVVDQEVDTLKGRRQGLFVCGISQGGAIGLWAMLCQKTSLGGIGGFVGLSTWLPFSDAIQQYLSGRSQIQPHLCLGIDEVEAEEFVSNLMGKHQAFGWGLLDTPIFLGHGSDDTTIDFELGKKVKGVLEFAGVTPEWRVYQGAELSGHWIKEPEGLVDVANFFKAQVEKSSAS